MAKSFGDIMKDIGKALGLGGGNASGAGGTGPGANSGGLGSLMSGPSTGSLGLPFGNAPNKPSIIGGGGGGGGGSQSAQKPKPVTGPYDPADVASYLERRKKQLAGQDTGINLDETPEQYIAKAEKFGTQALSKYLDADEIAGMTQRQKLAASELFTNKGAVGVGNFLSDEDLAFIREGGGSGSVYSPSGAAIKTGGKESLSFLRNSTDTGIARAVELGRVSKEDLTPEQLIKYEAGAKKRAAAKTSGQTKEVLRGPEAAALESAEQGLASTILTSGQGIVEEEEGLLRDRRRLGMLAPRRSLTGGGLIQ